MISHNFLTYSGKIIVSILREILYFPLWWYSVGFFRAIKKAFGFWRAQEKTLGFSVWLKNIFVPMYGQSDLTGRLISFLIRLVQVIFRGALLFVVFALVLFFLIFWLLIPIFLLLTIAFQLSQ